MRDRQTSSLPRRVHELLAILDRGLNLKISPRLHKVKVGAFPAQDRSLRSSTIHRLHGPETLCGSQDVRRKYHPGSADMLLKPNECSMWVSWLTQWGSKAATGALPLRDDGESGVRDATTAQRPRSRRRSGARIPPLLVGLIVRSATAVRVLARLRLWPKRQDFRQMSSGDFHTLMRTTGMVDEVAAAEAEERADSAHGGTALQSAEGLVVSREAPVARAR
jgi:hypothetical protein